MDRESARNVSWGWARERIDAKARVRPRASLETTMNWTTKQAYNDTAPRQRPDPILEELREMRAEVTRLRRLFDEWATADLNGRFPYGDGRGDRWSRRRPC
jgi:hypothetical protein